MGTGKTTIGKLLASRLGIKFIDMDQLIEEEAGRSISEIFADFGEPYFRELENKLAIRLTDTNNTVIATGGGIVKNSDNMRWLSSNGVIIALTADVDIIVARTNTTGVRPLLDEKPDDRYMMISKLLRERMNLYQKANLSIDTSLYSPLDVVDNILQYLRTMNLR